MEEWASVNRATFSSAHGVNGIDKSSLETDIKYHQVQLWNKYTNNEYVHSLIRNPFPQDVHCKYMLAYKRFGEFCFAVLNKRFFSSGFFQSSSNLSSYVPACAYSPPNQYGVYGGPAANYMTTGHHWQSQSASLAHPNSGATMQGGDLHTAMSFKHSSREGN